MVSSAAGEARSEEAEAVAVSVALAAAAEEAVDAAVAADQPASAVGVPVRGVEAGASDHTAVRGLADVNPRA